MADYFGEAAKYFGKKKAGRTPLEEGMDVAIGGEITKAERMPYGPGEVLKSGDVAKEWTGPRTVAKDDE